METISNAANTAASTVSNLIYGQPNQTTNETGGKEPVSGQTGKGTVAEPYDQGNLPTPLAAADKNPIEAPKKTDGEFLKLDPVHGEPQHEDGSAKKHEEGAPKIHSNAPDSTYVGMPIVPLNPDQATSGIDAKSSSTTEATGTTADKTWKDTPLDDISRSGAPGAGPTAPSNVTPAAPSTSDTAAATTATTATPATTSTETKPSTAAHTDTTATSDTKTTSDTTTTSDSKTTETKNTPSHSSPHDTHKEGDKAHEEHHNTQAASGIPFKTTDTVEHAEPLEKKKEHEEGHKEGYKKDASAGDVSPKTSTSDSKGLAEHKPADASKSSEPLAKTSSEEKSGKMSHFKDKLKDKLHIGSKDK